MDANSSKAWSEIDLSDLEYFLDQGDTLAQVAHLLCRDEDEVRAKAKELGLTEHRTWRCAYSAEANPTQPLKPRRVAGVSQSSCRRVTTTKVLVQFTVKPP